MLKSTNVMRSILLTSRPGNYVANVSAPPLLIVGSLGYHVIELNHAAFARLTASKELVIAPGAGHLFEEPGTLDAN